MIFKSGSIKTLEIEVTPGLAAEMLATSIGNRKTRRWHVDMLAAAMRRGEWKLTHQGAAFDWNGALRDAHHRLMACAQSGVSITMLVTLGLDPDSFDAVDQGVNRTLSDINGWEKRIAEPLRLATAIARGSSRVTPQQVHEIASGGLDKALDGLVEYCGTARRYYSSAPMRLAAATTIMNGGDSSFVLRQYRALCLLDFDEMTQCSKALVRQVDSLKASASQTRETIARGLKVFDSSRAGISKIQVSDADIVGSVELVRAIILDSVGEGRTNAPTRRKTRHDGAAEISMTVA